MSSTKFKITDKFCPIHAAMSLTMANELIEKLSDRSAHTLSTEQLEGLVTARKSVELGAEEQRIWSDLTYHVTGDDFISVKSLTARVGNFYSLWSWLCGGFGADYPRPTVLILTGDKRFVTQTASVPYFDENNCYIEESVQHKLWKQMDGQLGSMEEYRDYCKQVILGDLITDNDITLATVRFMEEESSDYIDVFCNFETGRVIFMKNPVEQMIIFGIPNQFS